jgi:hypothetical protein
MNKKSGASKAAADKLVKNIRRIHNNETSERS